MIKQLIPTYIIAFLLSVTALTIAATMPACQYEVRR